MSRVIVSTHLTLDGVMQAPGQPDEDTRGGFEHGGWQRPYGDQVMSAFVAQKIGAAGGLLLGRRTYENFAAFWSGQSDDNPFAAVMNNLAKFVASTTLKEPLAWANSTLLKGDAADAVADLKQAPGKDLIVIGSGELARTLMQHELVDEYRLLIHPLVLGRGLRLFTEGKPPRHLRLVDTVATTTGVVIATYVPSASGSEPKAK